MHILINGSQKNKSSNSEYFLKYISKNLNNYKLFNLKKNNYEDIINSFDKCNNIVIAFPLYVDSPNTITLSFLDYIFDNNIYINKNIYIIINCGFREGVQNITALNIIKNWCLKVHANYCGSVLIGAGEVAGDKNMKFLSKKVFKGLDNLSNNIKRNTKANDIITTISLLNNRLYCLAANKSWYKDARKNGLKNKDIKIQ